MDCEGKRAECKERCNSISTVVNLSSETIINVEELERINMPQAYTPKKFNNYIPHISKHLSKDPSFKETYTPKFVSIGPYFRDDDTLKISNLLKKDYLVNLFKRGRGDPSNDELYHVYNECLKCVKEKVDDARAYYADEIDLPTEEFAAMLVLDGSFILEHLINYNLQIEEEQLWSDKLYPKQLWTDLIMLENQVPFFILEELLKHVKDPLFDDVDASVKTQFLKSMVLWYLVKRYVNPWLEIKEEETVYHMLHLVHLYARPQEEGLPHAISSLTDMVKINLFRCTEINNSEKDYPHVSHVRVLLETVFCPLRLIFLLIFGVLEMLFFYVFLFPVAHIFWRGEWPSRDSIPSATELQKVMVKVKKQKNVEQNSGMNYDVRLRDRTLFMSKVTIDGYTAPFLQNLVTLEETLPRELPSYFSHYANFMQYFIRTREDVELLEAEGILVSNLGSDDQLISYFNNLLKDHTLRENDQNKMTSIIDQLKRRYRNPVYQWWGIVRTNYFSNPWTIIALFIAAAQLLQTIEGLHAIAKSKEF